MNKFQHAVLPDRGLLRISGADASDFLQGLVSNDVTKAGPDRAIYAALLTPQGKYLFDFFIVGIGDDLFLECESDRAADLAKRLGLYKLRAQVTLEVVTDDWDVTALWGQGVCEGHGLPVEPGAAASRNNGVCFVDPRQASAGLRLILPSGSVDDAFAQTGTIAAMAADYDRHRLGLGLPDGSRDMIAEKSVLMESGFDDLHGIDWQKGCYMGQELTARTKYRGLVKKRLVPVNVDGPLPAPGTPIVCDGKNAGELRSGLDGRALAILRFEYLDPSSMPLTADGHRVTPDVPDWITL